MFRQAENHVFHTIRKHDTNGVMEHTVNRAYVARTPTVDDTCG